MPVKKITPGPLPITEHLAKMSALTEENVRLTSENRVLKAKVSTLETEIAELRLKVEPPKKVVAKTLPVKKRKIVWKK